MLATKMDSIVHPVNLLVDMEYERAKMMYGGMFANAHEGFGVIAEEVQEAAEEAEKAIDLLSPMLRAIRADDKVKIVDKAYMIRDRAVNAAAEMIQVAAMCEKLVKTMEGA